MSTGPFSNMVFQLSILSQNDQPNPSCPGCSVGDQIHGEINAYNGCTLLTPSMARPSYPTSDEPVYSPVLLPIPSSDPPPTPTWYFMVDGDLKDVSVMATITTPGFPPCKITLNGATVQAWAKVNEGAEFPTNQVYQEGNCGVFGYAQENAPSEEQPKYLIYTITAGVCNPQINPPA